MEDEIRALIILEILGRPAGYIVESMENIANKIGTEKGIRIITKKIHEARAVEKTNNLFTTFSEIEIAAENIETLFRIMFAYHPSHVDIISPENFVLTNTSINLISNEIIRKLHQYDEIAKILSMERNIFASRLKQAGIMPEDAVKDAMAPKTAPETITKTSGKLNKAKQKGKKSKKKK